MALTPVRLIVYVERRADYPPAFYDDLTIAVAQAARALIGQTLAPAGMTGTTVYDVHSVEPA